MKMVRVWVGVLVLVLISTATASGISLCDYQSPETSLIDAVFSFSYQFYNDAMSPAVDVSTGSVGSSFDRLRDTESVGFVAWVDGRVGITGFFPDEWLAEGAATFRYYVAEEMPLFGFGGFRAIAATGQTQLGLKIVSGFG